MAAVRPSMLRIAYVCEFLLALLAITVVWAQVGGQDDLDLMPWYDKLFPTLALALVTVFGTVAVVARQRVWNARTLVCLALAIMIVCAMGVLTYYYHVQEDEEHGRENTAGASICRHIPLGQCT